MNAPWIETVEDDRVHRACERLMVRYADAMDRGDPEAFRAIYADDAVWLRPGKAPIVGAGAMVDSFMDSFRARPAGLIYRHLLTNILITRTGPDTASGVTYSTVLEGITGADGTAPAEGMVDCMLHYLNRFTCVDGVWKVAEHQSVYVFRR